MRVVRLMMILMSGCLWTVDSFSVQREEREVIEETLTALLNALNYDQTPNVRLAAIDALAGFYDRDVVRLGLIESLAKQTSPLIQIALVNLFVELEEKQSLQTLGFLQGNEMFNPTVRRRAGWAIEQLQ